MIRLPRFTWHAPETVREVVQLLANAEGAVVVAGGTDLVPNLKRRQSAPRALVSLSRIAALRGVVADGDGIRIGAGTSLTAVARDPLVRERFPALAAAVSLISTPILRNMGTLGGNLCLDTRCTYLNQGPEWRTALGYCMKAEGTICRVAPSSPTCLAVNASDGAPILLALRARVVARSPEGEREFDLADLYARDGIQYLTLRPGEILTGIHVPAAAGWRVTYRKLARRGSFDFPVLGVAVAAEVTPRGEVQDARVVLNALASAPLRVREAEAALVGRALSEETIRLAADAASVPGKPMDNTDADPIWRKRMIRVQVTRALEALKG